MPQGWSSEMYSLQCWFRVVARHIGSDSNPDLDPEFPDRLLDRFVQYIICLPTKGKYSNVYISSALTDEKSSSPHPYLYKEIYALHLLCLITVTDAYSGMFVMSI